MITTVLGLPASGKSTNCNKLVNRWKTAGFTATWRPEPTDDVPNFVKAGCSPDQISCIILARFLRIDREPANVDYLWRDSDYYTSLLLFGGEPQPERASQIIRSNALVYLKISPELQRERILKRNRSIANFELQYCSQEWHDKVQRAFEMYPCCNKTIYEQTN